MADNFDLMATALKAVCPNNEILLDNAGKPSVMVRIPKMTYAQLGMGESTALFPAFIINGQEVDEIYISKYLNIVQNGRAYSLPGVDPAASMNFDQARSYCEAKGDGWHCMTRMEWGLLMRICEMQGFIPLGNNNYGKHSSEQFYKAIPTFIDTGAGGKTGRTATGTGPLTWYHDNSPSGIAATAAGTLMPPRRRSTSKLVRSARAMPSMSPPCAKRLPSSTRPLHSWEVEAMTEWGVVGVIVVLLGLLGTVTAPMIRLNTTLTKLNDKFDTLNEKLTGVSESNHASHRRLWEHEEMQDSKLHDHETRIQILEHGPGCPANHSTKEEYA